MCGDEKEFAVKLRYLHRNPVKRGLVDNPADWKWSSFRHYALREIDRIRMDRRRQRDKLKGWTRADILDPRLAPKEQARTWGTPRMSGVSTKLSLLRF